MQSRLVVLTFFLFLSPAAADVMEAEQEFNVIDDDGDGAIQRSEAEHSTRYPLLPMVFDAVDLDGSGAVEFREWDRARSYLRSLEPGGPGAIRR